MRSRECAGRPVRAHRPGDSDLRAVPILAGLERHGVSYVLVGSYGAIVQGVDLPITDLDIVPATGSANRDRLVAALKDLGARERRGEVIEAAYELMEDPSSLTDTTFWTFTTEYGDLDVVLRPAGFPQGYDDLVDGVVIVRLVDEGDPTLAVEAVVADVSAIYTSKRLAGRQKDIESLPAFTGIHPTNAKEAVRQRYLQERARRSASDPGKPSDGT
jgi:hypothetical protein